MPKTKFKYRGREESTVKQRATQKGGSFDSYTKSAFPTFKPDTGKHRVRILPLPSSHDFDKYGDHWGIDLHVHYGIGPDNSSYLCLRKHLSQNCPMCNLHKELTAEGDEDGASKVRVSTRVLAWIIDRDDEKAGPMLWAMPQSVSRDISAASTDERDGILLIDDPENGYDVIFSREGANLKTKYNGIKIARDASPLADDEKEQDEWLEFIEENPLIDTLNFYEEDYIEALLMGKSSKKDDDGEEDRGTRSRGKVDKEDDSRSRRGRTTPKEEETPAEEDERPSRTRGRSEERDEADEKPARSSRHTAKDDEPEPEPEERAPSNRRRAADEKPKRSSKDDDDDDNDREIAKAAINRRRSGRD